MGKEFYFEIFLKKNCKLGWVLYDVFKDCDDVICKVYGLLCEFKDGFVCVIKEKFDEVECKFCFVVIFEGGQDCYKIEIENDVKVLLLCLILDDLFKLYVCDIICCLFIGWFECNKVIFMELLYWFDLVEMLEVFGIEFQYVVQKIVVVSVQDSDVDVQIFVKQFNDLVQKGLKWIYKDQCDGCILEYFKGKLFVEVVVDIYVSDSWVYILCGVMVDVFKDKCSYGDKLDVLFDMFEYLLEEEKVCEFVCVEVDGYLIDVIGFDVGCDVLLGKCNDLGEIVECLICFYDGDLYVDVMSLVFSGVQCMVKCIVVGELDECCLIIVQ